MSLSNRAIKKILNKYGLKRKFISSISPWYFALLIIFISLIIGIFVHYKVSKIDPANASILIMTIGAFMLGLQQWRLNKHEISLEKFYDRLDIVNRRLDEWTAARSLVRQFWTEGDTEECYEKAMYVYVEIDNLEYVIEKYLKGYMETKDALRGVTTFKSRCVSEEFRKLVCKQVSLAGYKSTTIEIVHKICDLTSNSPPMTT